MLIHWIWLATRSGMSDRGRAELLRRYADAEELFFAPEEELSKLEGITKDAVKSLLDKNLAPAQKILRQCSEKGIRILCWPDAAYPARLKHIPDPPVVLYYKGNLPDFDSVPLIGVVGTRKASAYGLTVAKRMGYQISACGGIVVSGVAYGIDGMAMRGALTAGAPVIGVLGSGADVVYPPSNHSLFEDVERYGCLLTEFPPGTPPIKPNFPRRNRIISGLSCGVLVVEAPEISGALITARKAAEQGRDVFVVPGNIDVSTCLGSNALLRDGAIAVSSGWDVMSEYESLYPDAVRSYDGKSIQSAYPDEVEAAAAQEEKELPKVAQKAKLPKEMGKEKLFGKKKKIDNTALTPYIDADMTAPDLTESERKVVDLIRQGNFQVDDIMAKADLGAGSILAALTTLEIKSVIKRLPGKRVEMKK